MLLKELALRQTAHVVLMRFLGVCAFVVALCFSALIKIPLLFTPVPITLQTMVVCLSGAFLGPRLGLAAVASYLALGVFGVPLFTQTGCGLGYFFGPTGGYLIGFLLASVFVATLIRAIQPKSLVILFAIMFCAMLVIYFIGCLWLCVGYRWTLKNVFFLGAVPFVMPDMLKALLAALIYKRFKG